MMGLAVFFAHLFFFSVGNGVWKKIEAKALIIK